jgi:hypothetical protein
MKGLIFALEDIVGCVGRAIGCWLLCVPLLAF